MIDTIEEVKFLFFVYPVNLNWSLKIGAEGYYLVQKTLRGPAANIK